MRHASQVGLRCLTSRTLPWGERLCLTLKEWLCLPNISTRRVCLPNRTNTYHDHVLNTQSIIHMHFMDITAWERDWNHQNHLCHLIWHTHIKHFCFFPVTQASCLHSNTLPWCHPCSSSHFFFDWRGTVSTDSWLSSWEITCLPRK